MLQENQTSRNKETKSTSMMPRGLSNSLSVECSVVSQAKTVFLEIEEKSMSRKIQSLIDTSMETRIKASMKWTAIK